MVAIAEMLAAILMGIVELIVLPLQIAAELLGLGLEFLFISLVQGPATAREKLKQRQAARSVAAAPHTNPSNDVEPAPLPHRARRFWIQCCILVLVTSVGIGWIWISHVILQRRIETTRTQIAGVADGFIRQVNQPNAALPEGQLPDLDAWGQPCELFVDKWLLGTMIVVRSAGGDHQTETLDDLLAIRFKPAGAKAIGMGLAKLGIKAVRERLKNILPGNGNAVPDKQIDFQVQ